MISMRIAFVLQLLDEFTGKSLTNAGVVFYEGDRVVSPVKKPDGMYVFLDEFDTECTISIVCAGFHDKVLTIDRNTLDKVNPIIVVRLFGKPGGAFSYRYGLSTGTIKKEKGLAFPAEVYAVRKKPFNLFFKSYREEEGKHILVLQGFCLEPLIGLAFRMGEGKEASEFIVKEKVGSNEYCICPIGNKSVQIKQGSPLFRIYRSVTDEKGNYSIPIDEGVEFLEEIVVSPVNLP